MNASEAMHTKIYPRKKPLFEIISGCSALIKFCKHMQRRYLAARGMYEIRALSGQLTHYGVAEPWKLTFQAIGRTKFCRGRCKGQVESSGRAPDTANAPLRKPRMTRG